MTIMWDELELGSAPTRYLALADAIEAAMDAGQLAAGDQLPTHRALADRLGVSVGTVTRAYAEAERRGCRTAWLDTYDFQARPFYERHGYVMFAEFDDLPGGHRRWFMKKRLGGSAGDP